MVTRTDATSPAVDRPDALDRERLYQDGIVAGVIGAATIAVWFLIMDTMRGRPLQTPAILGTAFFRPGELAAVAGGGPISFEMVLMYTWVHGLVFCVLGGIASWFLVQAEKNPNLGFGILLLFVVFEFGFVLVAMLSAEPVLRAVTWPAILVGNLLAAAAMAAYFWRRHPNLTIWP
ncbi:MAG: hypothetical protein ACRELA_00045 [Candidatus Rokuibacteriota bacterium]